MVQAYATLEDPPASPPEPEARPRGPAPPRGQRAYLPWACAAAVVPALLAYYSLLCISLPPRPLVPCQRAEAPAVAEGARPEAAPPSLLVLAIGDWGGMPVWPYVTPAQLAVRTAMADSARRTAAERALVLALGDNFYNSGVEDAADMRFQRTFEDVYVKGYPELSGADMWRVVAGNHDYHQNVTAQIAYTARSTPWHFPSEYYTFSEVLGTSAERASEGDLGAKPGAHGARRDQGTGESASVQFVMVDTVLLSAGTDWGLGGDAEAKRGEDHWRWLNETLAASTAEFLVVAGHYPVWSVSHHGPTPGLVQRLRPLLAAHGVSAYLFGHDHCAQAIEDGAVQHHGVGGAHLLNYGAPNMLKVPEGSVRFFFGGQVWPANVYKGAFAALEFSPTELTVRHLDSDGNELYVARHAPRASARPGASARR